MATGGRGAWRPAVGSACGVPARWPRSSARRVHAVARTRSRHSAGSRSHVCPRDAGSGRGAAPFPGGGSGRRGPWRRHCGSGSCRVPSRPGAPCPGRVWLGGLCAIGSYGRCGGRPVRAAQAGTPSPGPNVSETPPALFPRAPQGASDLRLLKVPISPALKKPLSSVWDASQTCLLNLFCTV